jgi:hypothetical protein
LAITTLNALRMSQSSNNTPRGTPSEVGGTRTTNRDDSKVAKPDLYYGDRQGLDDWLNQMDLYFIFTPIEERKKTIFASTYLRGRAQHWMKPMLQKFLNDQEDTDGIMMSFVKFKKEVRRIFGISNEDKVAVRLIQHIRQHTSASDYAAKFQEYAQVTDWDDSALMTMYRRGLKENVKDELMRTGEKIESLDELIRATIEIDDNLYERAMERRHDIAPRGKSGYVPYRSNNNFKGKKFNRNNQYQDPYGPMPMELDVTEGRRSQGKKQFKGKSQMTCYACNQKGHMARDCRSKNKVPRRQFNITQKTPTGTYGSDHHEILSWTECYDDACLVHYDAKMGSDWVPPTPVDQGRGGYHEINVITKIEDLEEGEIEEEEVESDPEEDDDEEESEEESSDDNHDDHLCDGKEGIHALHAYVPSCFTKMFDDMMRHGEEAFPSINGQRFLHPHNFDNMLDQIRNAFREHRLVVVDYDFKAFIVERPPLGSTFAPAGYIIPSGERVNNSMRDGIKLLRSRYEQAQQQQRKLYERHLQEEYGLFTSLNGKEKVRFDSPVSDDSGKE